jgi:hypothetical protein
MTCFSVPAIAVGRHPDHHRGTGYTAPARTLATARYDCNPNAFVTPGPM